MWSLLGVDVVLCFLAGKDLFGLGSLYLFPHWSLVQALIICGTVLFASLVRFVTRSVWDYRQSHHLCPYCGYPASDSADRPCNECGRQRCEEPRLLRNRNRRR